MKREPINTGILAPLDKQETCPVETLPSAPAGIVGTTVEPGGRSLTIDYDPHLISDESVRQVAEHLAPERAVALGSRLNI